MNRRVFPFGIFVVLLAGILSACTSGNASESSISGTGESEVSAPNRDEVGGVGLGELLDVGDFTVLVDSAGQDSDDSQSGLQSGDPEYVAPSFWMSYTVTYTGTGPMVKWKVPWVSEDVFVESEPEEFISHDESPVSTGDVFTYKVRVEANLAKEDHTFYFVGWDESSEQYPVLGTITLGPESLS